MASYSDIIEAFLDCFDEDSRDDLCIELDEIVHDLAAQDESIPLGAIDEGDPQEILDRRSSWASDKNNEGAEAQLGYILSFGALADAEAALESIASSEHARLRMRQLVLEAQTAIPDPE